MIVYLYILVAYVCGLNSNRTKKRNLGNFIMKQFHFALQDTEERAFDLLVHLMYGMDLRRQFQPEMMALQVF